MKVIIAGSRDIYDSVPVINTINNCPFNITEVVTGKASGVDHTGEWLAILGGIPVAEYPAEWDKYGNRAGPIRNRRMAMYADALILVWDGKSRGSANMKAEMEDLGKPVFEVIV